MPLVEELSRFEPAPRLGRPRTYLATHPGVASLLVDDHERAKAKILIRGRRTTAIGAASLGFVRLASLSLFSASPIQGDLDIPLSSEILFEVVPQLELIARHNEQEPHFLFAD